MPYAMYSSPKRSLLSRMNLALLIAIIALNAYIVIAPLTPKIAYWWHSRDQKQLLLNQLHAAQPASSTDQNHIVVPAMLLDQPILEGSVKRQYSILDAGIWRWPYGSTPEKGGNTVLIGHRFTYTNPQGVFYFLDKVKPGDEIGLYWNNHKYTYRATSVSEVSATDTSIENPTDDARLTLFTCTPLWLPKQRLVVVAALESY